MKITLEPVCCKKQQKKVPGLWNRGPLKILNGIKLILDDHGNHLDFIYYQFGIKVISLRGDDIGTGRRRRFWPSVYIFAA